MIETAILFSGQGAQYVGMGRDLSRTSPAAGKIYETASTQLGIDLLNLDEEALADTRYTQLATFTLSMAAYAALIELTGNANSFFVPGKMAMAGFSLGEYSAFCAAGVIDFNAALDLIACRSQAMSRAAAETNGAMYAILGLDDDFIVSELEKAPFSDRVFPANFNSPGQLVIAGYADDCEQAANHFLESGAKRAVRLKVSGAFHTKLMQSAAQRLAGYAANIRFKSSDHLLFSNISADELTALSSMPDYLASHMVSPVQWTKTISNLKERGVKRYIELGPGKTLCGLAKRVDRKAVFLNIDDSQSLEEAFQMLAR